MFQTDLLYGRNPLALLGLPFSRVLTWTRWV
jgi:hypothetical protein